ncbi:MAG: zinc ribbon domain-containing protein [Acidobacteriota bacterium]|nr:zinc ribbon domain-containing protein [Acidobacteriota bacterium]
MSRPEAHNLMQARNGNPEGDDALRMIPNWSIALAILVFAAVQVLFHHVLPHQKHDMLPMRLLMGYSWGTAFASYVLLVGYVSRDVKRRKMTAGLWMLIVILMPGGIGAVVYFLLRQPILSRCPHCRTEIAADFHFCPQCQFQMAPVCGQCYRGVRITDAYCTQCGHDLTEDHTPSRLRAYSE